MTAWDLHVNMYSQQHAQRPLSSGQLSQVVTSLYLQLLSGPDVSECQHEALLAGSDIQNVISSKPSVLSL